MAFILLYLSYKVALLHSLGEIFMDLFCISFMIVGGIGMMIGLMREQKTTYDLPGIVTTLMFFGGATIFIGGFVGVILSYD